MRLGAIAATLFAAGTGALGCGGEHTFSAQEFVDKINAEGVELSLGEELFTDEEGKELYDLRLEPVPGPSAEAGGEGEHQHDAGSLSVHDDTEGADGEFESCQVAADLLCYQAANVVVVLQGSGIEAERLAVAIERLSAE